MSRDSSLRGWETRRANIAAAEARAEARSASARKGWETRWERGVERLGPKGKAYVDKLALKEYGIPASRTGKERLVRTYKGKEPSRARKSSQGVLFIEGPGYEYELVDDLGGDDDALEWDY